MRHTFHIELMVVILRRKQTPQLEGHHRDERLFDFTDLPAPRVPPFRLVTWKSNVYTMQAGAAHGVKRSDEYSLYNSNRSILDKSPYATMVPYKILSTTTTLKAVAIEMELPIPRHRSIHIMVAVKN